MGPIVKRAVRFVLSRVCLGDSGPLDLDPTAHKPHLVSRARPHRAVDRRSRGPTDLWLWLASGRWKKFVVVI